MNKKLLKRIIERKACKRIVSGLIAVVLFFGALPMLEISETIKNLDLYSMRVSAAGEHIDDPTDTEYLPESSGYVEITTPQLEAYSQRANEYQRAHQNDKILIKGTAGASESEYILLRSFVPLGSEKYPFKGTVVLDEFGPMINMQTVLFDYVFDSVELYRISTQSGVTSTPFEISRAYAQGVDENSKKQPILANNVIHDDSSSTVNTWAISIRKPNVDDSTYTLQKFGGLIGKMWNSYSYSSQVISTDPAKLNLNVTMNTETGDSENVIIQGTGSTGFACGIMQANTELTLDLTSDRTIAEVSTTDGHVGGFVGSMASGASFTYTCTASPFKDDTKTTIATTASNGYAGGIVGYNNGGSVDISANHTINQTIKGVYGEGGLYGYYKPAADVTIKASDFVINDCVLDGAGQSGGLIGLLDSANNVTINVDENIASKRSASGTSSTTYGGLIGLYKVDSKAHALTINGSAGKKVSADSASKATYYGGGIGKIYDAVDGDTDGTAYVKFNGFTLNNAANAASLTFGGLVGVGNKAYIDAKDVSIAVNGTYKGGALVGSLGYGVLRMDGTIDISGAKSADPTVQNSTDETLYVGIIVGYRDDALIYAKPNWKLKRNMNGAAVDDIGTWGQAVRFDGSSLTSEDQLFTVDDTAHTITVNAPTSSYTSIGSVADFAKTALCFQIDASKNAYVSFSSDEYTWDTIKAADITITNNLDLSGTGFAGFTRDNGGGTENKFEYSGTVTSTGTRPTITLAIGEAYGYNGNTKITSHTTNGLGKQYRHIYSGLFGSVSNFALDNVNLAGNVYVNTKTNTMYAGSAAAVASGDFFTVSNAAVTTAFSHTGEKKLSLGGVLGEALNDIGSITVSGVNVTANISGNASAGENDVYFGGVIGRINETSNNNHIWSFTNVSLTGSISNDGGVEYNRIGGLVAIITQTDGTARSNRKLNLSQVTVSGLSLSASKGSGKNPRTIGGLLGYGWYNVDVDFDQVTASANESAHNTITLENTASGYGDIGGLFYSGTGYWTVKDANDIQLNDLVVSTPVKSSLGLLINRSWNASDTNNYKAGNSSALYLELQNTASYKITGSALSGISGFTVFDEIVAYSAIFKTESDGTRTYYSGDSENLYVLQNGASVISIKTAASHGLNMDNGTTASASYTAQTSQGNVANPYTRYYYNIDAVKDEDSDAAKLMRWGLAQYAHPSIQECFKNTMTDIPNATYDMQGYSWYPVDVDKGVTVNGTFKLYNKEFEGSEDEAAESTAGHTFDRTSLDKTQHYLLHNGLFRNVNAGKTLSVGTVTLQGNVGVTSYGSGALICGKVQGGQDNAAKVNVTGTIELDRVYVHDITTSQYAPLAINKVGNYAQLTISANTKITKVKNKESLSYRKMMTDLSSYPGLTHDTVGEVDCPRAGSSLIGDVEGSNGNGVYGVSVEFVKMILDGRTNDLDLSLRDPEDDYSNYNNDLGNKYGSDRTIFTQATFLNKFKYEPGSYGKYNFTWDDDWSDFDPETGKNSGQGVRNVTYGKELGFTDSDTYSEYPGKERYYYGEPHEGETTKCFVNPVNLWDYNGDYSQKFKDDFLPYVAIEYNETNKTHQIMVNQSSEGFDGCGTYNDPYTLEKGDNFVALSQTLSGNHTIKDINVPVDSSGKPILTGTNSTWHNKDYGHKKFSYYNNPSVDDGQGGTTTGTSGYYSGAPVLNPAAGTFISTTEMETYLAGAYYILAGDSDKIEITGNFKGLGYTTNNSNTHVPFRGVIIGNATKTIVNKTAYPLIANANGCVLKDVQLTIQSANNITVNGIQGQFNLVDTTNTNAYGGLIGKVHGGDNIIDNCLVDYSSFTKQISLNNSQQLAPVGGYIGVVVNGGVIFRNMESRASAYESNKLTDLMITGSVSGVSAPSTSSSNLAWLYVNPYIGRVINGYVVNESTAYRPFEDGVREYGDGEKIYYTETKNDQGVVTSSSFNGTEENKVGVTLKNGTKHYSITDICADESKLNKLKLNSKTSVEVPNAQAWFIMSLIVNSGMGKKTLGYNQDYQISRWAKYTGVKRDTSATTQPDDYSNSTSGASGDNKDRAGYLAYAYTTNAAYAKDMANQSSSVTLTATGNTTYYLPDGYKGLGNVYQKLSETDNGKTGAKVRMKINDLDGNGNTISQNTLFYHYSSGFDKGYNPNANSDGEYVIGMGLITYQPADAKAKNLILTGNVKADTIDNTWTTVDTNLGYAHIKYNSVNARMISVGSLFGCIGANQTLTSVGLQNVNVRGVRYVGGMIGATNTSAITISNPYKVESNKIKVHSGLIAGGVIGKINSNVLDLDFNNCSFSITEVVSECVGLPNTNYYEYGVGGIVGMCRSKLNEAASPGSGQSIIKNVIIGSENDTECSTVKCENANIYTGGLVGIFNRAYLELSNCKIYNMNVEAQFAAGGLVGHWATAGGSSTTAEERQSQITNTIISGTIPSMMPEIKSTGKNTGTSDKKFCSAGGFIGSGKDDMNNVVIQNSSIDNYKITAIVYAGGAAGSWGDSSTTDTNNWKSSAVQFNNFRISDCTISATDTSSGSAGGLLGNLNDGSNKNANNYKFRLYGYNVLSKNLTITGKNKGYICGRNGRTNTNDIKLAGYSRQDSDNNRMISELVGIAFTNGTTASTVPYGNNGYVIFADYNDNASGSNTQYSWFSNVNNTDLSATTNVETMRSVKTWTQSGTDYTAYDNNKDMAAAYTDAGYSETISGTTYKYKNENFPFVTSSPSFPIDAGNILTGDGISKIGSAYSYDNSTFKKIRSDITAGTVNKAYGSAPSIDADYTASHYSTSNAEFLTKDNAISDFPLIIVDDSNRDNVTTLINGYLGTLSNTSYNFADTEGNKAVYNLELRKMVFNSNSKKFEDKTGDTSYGDGEANLRIDGSGASSEFYMDPQYVDTGLVQQFTLIDVQFYDPSTVNGSDVSSATVAYHLYVPVYTRRIIRYNFYATLASNTNYYKDAYKHDSAGNFSDYKLYENLGSPITYAFEYQYFRSSSSDANDEWRDALNGGENVIADSNYRKTLEIKKVHSGANFWPSTTKMVLVDSSKEGKNYYLDTPPTAVSGTKVNLDLTSFTDGSGANWTPSTFNDLMDITVQQDNNGTLVETNSSSDATFYVDTSSGRKYYRLYTQTDGDAAKYTVTSVEVSPERYYITFLTASESNGFYFYDISSPSMFDRSTGGNDQIDPAQWRPNKVNKNSYCKLLIADMYEDNFSTSATSLQVSTPLAQNLISSSNNTVSVTMTTTVKLKDTEYKGTIASEISRYQNESAIYHAFLMTYGKKLTQLGDELVGIVKNSQIVSTSFKVASGVYTAASFPANAQSVRDPVTDNTSSSFIKLSNSENLMKYIGESTNDYAVTFQAKITLAYYDDVSRSAQFPQNDPNSPVSEIGSRVIGYSNIASSTAGVAYSTTSQKKEGTNRYYVANSAAATLSYNMAENTSDKAEVKADGQYRSLGINAKTDSEGYILSNAEYDTHKLTTTSDYIEFTLTLSEKNSYVFPAEGNPASQGTALKISDYLYGLEIYGSSDVKIFDQDEILDGEFTLPDGVVYVDTAGSSGNVYKVRVRKDKLKTRGDAADGVYILPIKYKVKTGDGSGRLNETYSNYKVTVTAEMYNPDAQFQPENYLRSSWAQDYLIYTNAKVETNVIN